MFPEGLAGAWQRNFARNDSSKNVTFSENLTNLCLTSTRFDLSPYRRCGHFIAARVTGAPASRPAGIDIRNLKMTLKSL
jgi:hypothetical protein